MTVRAIVRPVSPRIGECALTHLPRQPIDAARASEQHDGYRAALSDLGVSVLQLPARPELPDSVFVEDTAVVLDEVALLAPMGTHSRRAETESMLGPLRAHREVVRMPADVRLEGGDVMRAARRLFVGVSTRSDRSGREALERLVRRHGYAVTVVPVPRCLHLKTGCTFLGDDTVVVNPGWVDADALCGLRRIEVHSGEPWAANTLRIRDTVLFPAGHPRTRERLEQAGFPTREVEISELAKAEAGLTCMSLVF